MGAAFLGLSSRGNPQSSPGLIRVIGGFRARARATVMVWIMSGSVPEGQRVRVRVRLRDGAGIISQIQYSLLVSKYGQDGLWMLR